MKKTLTLICALILICSCDVGGKVEVSANTDIAKAIPVTISQTNGTPFSYNLTATVDLSEAITGFENVEDVDINSLRYQYKSVSGNTQAVIQNASIVINGISVATISDVNVTEVAGNQTIYEITDSTILSQLEGLFKIDSNINLQFSGSALSDAGPLDFELEVSVSMTSTF